MNNFTWEGLLKGLIGSLPLIAILWKAVDKYFEYQSKKDKELIRETVKQVFGETLSEIREDIRDLKKDRERDNDRINEHLNRIYEKLGRN